MGRKQKRPICKHGLGIDLEHRGSRAFRCHRGAAAEAAPGAKEER